MNNNIFVVKSSEGKNRTDCFAWISKSKCNALSCKDCKNCKFYKHYNEVPNYSKYISKENLKICNK